MTKQNIDSLCVFLKLLYEETKDMPKLFPLQTFAKEYKLPYSSSVSTVLIEKGIVKRTMAKDHKSTYQWSTTTEPNRVMAEAIFSACRIKATNYNLNSIRRETSHVPVVVIEPKPKLSTTPVDTFKEQVNTLVTTLISMGFTKETALEIIRAQIK